MRENSDEQRAMLKKFINRFDRAGAAAMLLLCLASCDSVIYDYEGDCSVTYTLDFRYDWNMKFADAFASEVKSVSLYAFGSDGKLVWQKSESGDALAGGSMTLDLSPGDYHLLAWCGLESDGKRDATFSVPEAVVGQTTEEDLKCTLTRKRDTDGKAYTDTDLCPLFHGELDVTLPEDNDGGNYRYTMSLIKDTNHIRVILQHLSGEDVDVDAFSFSIEDSNGLMAADNSLLEDEVISYRAWNTETGEAGIDVKSSSKTITNVKAAIADLTVARMISGHDMILTIINEAEEDTEDRIVAKIPVIDYALLVKGYYDGDMSNQEYLDRQDDYTMTFFLDEDNTWTASTIYINSWRIVLRNTDIG